jgi:hypothetical protein
MTKRNMVVTGMVMGGILLILAVLLMLDLANRGLVWGFFWSQTGEEAPLAQVRGMVEWAGNLTRPQPINDPLLPINHKNDNPYGINTFLHLEVDPVKVDAQLQQIAEAGFGWIREEFTWEEIEVDGRGQFTDSRNDMDGDGTIDTISGWAKFDRIVDLAEKHGIRIQARLSNPPAWAQEPGVHTQTPPQDYADYVNFVRAIGERYQGRIQHYQIWNEPNIFPEWGANPDGSPRAVDPEAYTDLLCQSYTALKAVDPSIVVISGALAPTSELWGVNLNDFVFLQRMYDAGAGACFDVLSMQGYGLNSGPTDRRMRPVTVNVGRNQYIRELMVNNGDAHKPIWISEAAWNPVPDEAEAPDVAARYNFGQVTQEQAATYMPQFYARAQQEWAWVGVVNYWYFTRPDDSRKGESWYYFRMVEPDYSDDKPRYTPLPVYDAMKAHITGQTPVLYQGVHQLDGHWAVEAGEDAELVSLDSAQFGRALQTTSLTLTMQGTGLRLRWQAARWQGGAGTDGTIRVQVGDAPPQTFSAVSGDWHTTTIYQDSSLSPQPVQVRITAESPVLLDSLMVVDDRWTMLYPWVGMGVVLMALLVAAIATLRRRV